MNNIAIIYHDADFDGKLSNEACRFHLKRLHPNANIDSYGWDYGRPVPTPKLTHQLDHNPNEPVRAEWALYDEIYIVDLSVDELMARQDLFEKIVWIDHHASAIEKWDKQRPGLPPGTQFTGLRLDGVAACRLCWFYFLNKHLYTCDVFKSAFVDRKVEEPHLLRLAGEYDVWDHRDADAKALQFGLRALSDWDYRKLVDNEFMGAVTGARTCSDELVSAVMTGRSIKTYCDQQNDEYAKAFAHTIKWEGLTFCALNIGQRGNSDLLRAAITPEHDACFAWRYVGNGLAMVSLYHAPGKEHHDLSQIAVRYGGGGHKGACGFRITLAQLAEII